MAFIHEPMSGGVPTGSDIYLMNPDGTSQANLTPGPGYDFHPDWQPIPINAYARPKGATPFKASLVPAYKPCTAPNRTHGPSLAFPLCNPPAMASDELTLGTPEVNAKPARGGGYVEYATVTGNPATPADEADVQITFELQDVYDQQTLTDYTGELGVRTALRITDKLNTPHPGGPGAATVSDTTLGATVSCVANPDTTQGATCNLLTSADAIAPGAVTEGKRAVWSLGQVQVDDGGADGNADTPADNTLFMVQGVFVP